MLRFLYHPQTVRTSAGLLIARLIIGLMLVAHGWSKFNSPGGALHWMGPEAPVPAIFQGLALLSELGGGLALAFGFLTPIACLGILCTMATAIMTAHLHDPIMMTGKGGAKEPALLYLAPALLFLCSGAGVFSLDKLLFSRRDRL